MIMGAVMPKRERWKVYAVALSAPLLAALVILVILAEPDPAHPRVFLGVGILGATAFFMPFALIMLYGHHHPDRIDMSLEDEDYRHAFDLGRNMKIGLAAAAAIPPLIKLMLEQFGVGW